MSKYTVASSITVGVYTIVEADSVEQAAKLALERQITGLSHSAQTGVAEKSWWLGDGLNGDVYPFNLEVTNQETGLTTEINQS